MTADQPLGPAISDEEMQRLGKRLYFDVRDEIAEYYIKWGKRLIIVASVIFPLAGNYAAFSFVNGMVEDRIDEKLDDSLFQKTIETGREALAVAAATADTSIESAELARDRYRDANEAATLAKLDFEAAENATGLARVDYQKALNEIEDTREQMEEITTELGRTKSEIESVLVEINRAYAEITDRAIEIEGRAAGLDEIQSSILEEQQLATERNDLLYGTLIDIQTAIDEVYEIQEQANENLKAVIAARNVIGDIEQTMLQEAIDQEKESGAIGRAEARFEHTLEVIADHLRQGRSFDYILRLEVVGEAGS